MSPASSSTRANAAGNGEIAEFQGLYGAYNVSEILLQKLWLRREFDLRRARTNGGETLRVAHPGSWNRLSGPDFSGARLFLGERPVTGDVEVHFQAEAWTQHGHDKDPAYDNVVLHVVLFPPPPGSPPTRTTSGRAIPLLVLVDLLWHDLEEYAGDEAVAALSGRDPWPVIERLLALAPAARELVLKKASERRWREKVHFAGLRVRRGSWEEACHQTALEILGYRSNRAAMLNVAAHFPWSAWQKTIPPLEDLVAAAAETWTLRGVRPANHPRLRLEQYRLWMTRVPDWPVRLRAWRWPAVEPTKDASALAAIRRELRLPAVREAVAGGLCGGALGGSRLDTWITNLALPFTALAHAETAHALWGAWYPGDAPDALLEAARQLVPLGRRAPMANGLLQALLALHLDWQAGRPLESGTKPAADV